MARPLLSVLLATYALLTSAHYTFDVLEIDGVETNSGQYVRPNTRLETYMPTKFINSFDNVTPLSDDFRCNLGASSGNDVGVAEVAAGSNLAIKLAVGATIKHPGPAFIYMSKAPANVTSYAGDGDWFKIHEEGLCGSSDITTTSWCTWGKDRISFTIPTDTPNGEYLVRVEHIGLHGAHNGEAEFYYACAQVRVNGNGSGTPGPLVKIPGIYSADDASVNFSIWSGNSDYPMPEPPVWTSGGSVASSDLEKSAQNSSRVTEPTVQPTSTTQGAILPSHGSLSGAKTTSDTVLGCSSRPTRRRARRSLGGRRH